MKVHIVSEKKRMFVVMRVQKFEIEPRTSLDIEVGINAGKMVGYLPVYKTREDALADFPDSQLIEVKENGKDKDNHD